MDTKNTNKCEEKDNSLIGVMYIASLMVVNEMTAGYNTRDNDSEITDI